MRRFRSSLRLRALLSSSLLTLAASGCPPLEDDFSWSERTAEEGAPTTEGPHSGLYDLTGRLDATEVTEVESLAEDPGCIHPMDDCREDYLAFPERAIEHADVLPADELMAWIHDLLDAPQAGPVSHDHLADAVVDGLAIRFLLDGPAQEPVQARIHGDETLHGYRALRVVFEDPWVGDFGARLFLPGGPGPHPVVLAQHGHGTEAIDFIDAYGGLGYLDAGFALLGIEHRVTYANEWETEVGLHLLRHGFDLMGLHIYETLRAHRYIRWRADLDPDRVVLLGHSAGAQKTNLMVRISDSFAAAVTDNEVEITPEDVEYLHEGFVPELAPWQDVINDFDTAPVPVLKTGYGYPEGTSPILDFMLDHIDW